MTGDLAGACAELLSQVRQLHAPSLLMGMLVCYGCDLGPHPEGPPEWPCSTAEIVYTASEIKAYETDLAS